MILTDHFVCVSTDFRSDHGHPAVRVAVPDNSVLLRPCVAQVERPGQMQAGFVDQKREAGRSGARAKKSDQQVPHTPTYIHV